MPRTARFPRLEVDVTPERWETAVTATSGSCLIADAVKDQYPQFSGVIVDAQTIRFTDKAAGQRYTYLTPNSAQELLLYFDQGWSEPAEHSVRLRTPIKVETVTKARTVKAQREARKIELQTKRDVGEKLTGPEKRSLGQMEKNDARGYPEPPHTPGPITEVIGRREGNATVVGGHPMRRPRPEQHPNLLGGHNRLFGAKTARPARVFAEAVDDEVKRRLAAAMEDQN
jgi:hypothetical protein